MKHLTKSAYQKAISYIKNHARPLEKARYAFYFEDGVIADILSALADFQNADGGFGHGLECDLRLADSSVIATTVAFQCFTEFKIPGDHPMVVNACQYLMATYDAAHANWPIIPPNISDAPHAPWWAYRDDRIDNLVNPRAEIVGYLNAYPEHFPATLREQLTQAVVDYLFEQPDELEMHDLYCYLRLWQSNSLPSDVSARMGTKLNRIVDKTVDRSRDNWQDYSLNPLAVAPGPDSPFAERFREEIDQNLDYIIETQGEDGAWLPNWSWGEQWPDAWAQAQREWGGIITLGNLRTLQSFGRIDT
ncbi:MAG: hypothetical protein KC708_02725 [Anaerolineae bacterium]|nr:hypothetical protein [Anaerolineae bacterium]